MKRVEESEGEEGKEEVREGRGSRRVDMRGKEEEKDTGRGYYRSKEGEGKEGKE